MSLDDQKCKAYSEKVDGFVMGFLTAFLLTALFIFWFVVGV